MFVLSGGVFIRGGVLFLFCCLGLEVCFGLFGRDKRVRDPSGEEVLLVEVDDDDVLAGGLVTGSLQSSPSWLSSPELLEDILDSDNIFRDLLLLNL